MKEINFSISKGNIVLQAKDDTYLSARAALAVELSNKEGRYEMQADERDTHERKLLQSLKNAVMGLKAELNEHLINGDVDDNHDAIDITVSTPNSFREERIAIIGSLFENYISKRVISEWWKANYPSFAAQYDALAFEALNELRRSFYYKGEAELKLFNK